MSWAAKRRFIILLFIGTFLAASIIAIAAKVVSKPPSCVDNVQNQNETGIDCGGPCSYLCSAQVQPPTVLLTKAIGNGAGRVDVIALVENKNANAAAKNVPYRVQLFGSGQALIREITGTLDLPPGATEPVFIPGIVSGKQTVTNIFLVIDPSAPKWFTMANDPRVLPMVLNSKQSGSVGVPRIEAILANPSAALLSDVKAIVIVRDAQGSIIAASSAIIPVIPAQGQAIATFTWNNSFAGTAASIQVVPLIPLPDR